MCVSVPSDISIWMCLYVHVAVLWSPHSSVERSHKSQAAITTLCCPSSASSSCFRSGRSLTRGLKKWGHAIHFHCIDALAGQRDGWGVGEEQATGCGDEEKRGRFIFSQVDGSPPVRVKLSLNSLFIVVRMIHSDWDQF